MGWVPKCERPIPAAPRRYRKILPSCLMCCCKFSSAESGGELETFWVSSGSASRRDDDEEEEEELWCDDLMSTVSFSRVSLS